MKQSRLPISWLADAESNSDSSSEYEEEEEKRSNAHELQWTRVRTLEQMKTQRVMVHSVKTDLITDASLRVVRSELAHDRGAFVFDPQDFRNNADSLKVESYKLEEAELKRLASLASTLRQQVRSKAEMDVMLLLLCILASSMNTIFD